MDSELKKLHNDFWQEVENMFQLQKEMGGKEVPPDLLKRAEILKQTLKTTYEGLMESAYKNGMCDGMERMVTRP